METKVQHGYCIVTEHEKSTEERCVTISVGPYVLVDSSKENGFTNILSGESFKGYS